MLFQPQMLNSIKQDGNTFINVEHIKIWKLWIVTSFEVILVFGLKWLIRGIKKLQTDRLITHMKFNFGVFCMHWLRHVSPSTSSGQRNRISWVS
jgi:hypothetical protein